MKLERQVKFILSCLATTALCSPAVSMAETVTPPPPAPYIGVTLTDGQGNITTDIVAQNTGIYGKADTNNITIGDIDANITVGGIDTTGAKKGIFIDWGQDGNKLTMGNIGSALAEGDTESQKVITVSSQTNATGVELARPTEMDNMYANIDVDTVTGEAKGMHMQAYATAKSIEGDIDVKSESGNATGLYTQSDTTIESLSSDIKVSSTSGSALGVYMQHNSTIKKFTGNATVTSDSGDAVGMNLYATSHLGKDPEMGMAGTLTVKSTTGKATGIHLTDTTYNTISGTINVESGNEAVGIDLFNDAKIGTIMESAQINVKVKDLGNGNTGNAYGIYGDDKDDETGYAVSNIKGKFTVTNETSSAGDSTTGNAYGIFLNDDGKLGSLASDHQVHEASSSIVVNSKDEGKSYGVYSESDRKIYFEAGSTIVSTTGSTATGDLKHGNALYNEQYGVQIAEEDTMADGTHSNISGNIYAGDKNIVIESGNYHIASDTWTSSEIHLGTIKSGVATAASVTVADVMTTTATSLNLYLDSLTDYSELLVVAGGSMDLTSITEINFHFSDEFIAVWGTPDTTDWITLGEGGFIGLDDSMTVNLLGAVDPRTKYIVDNGEIVIHLEGADRPVDAVPEPTTATLSLVALIALLNRRRRRTTV